jgi:hypothetical protein
MKTPKTMPAPSLQSRILAALESEPEASAFGLAARLYPQVCGLVPTAGAQDVLCELERMEAEGVLAADRGPGRRGLFTRFRRLLRRAA